MQGGMSGNMTGSPGGPSAQLPGPSAQANGHSTSVMFIIYMVIGFTATLACIMVLTLLYFLIRCFLRRERTADCDPEGSDCSLALPPREIYIVVHPGGATTVAYRDDEVLEMKPRDKGALCKRFIIELDASTPSSVTSADFLIPASRPSAHGRPSSPPSATSRDNPGTGSGWSKRMLLFQSSHPASTDSGTYTNELWESSGSLLSLSPSQTSSSQMSSGRVRGRLSSSPSVSGQSSSSPLDQAARSSSISTDRSAQARRISSDSEEVEHPRCLPNSDYTWGAVQQSSSNGGRRFVEIELLCLKESLSDSGSPPSIYFNSLFRPDAEEMEHNETGAKPEPDTSP